jgi:hypothetical protein
LLDFLFGADWDELELLLADHSTDGSRAYSLERIQQNNFRYNEPIFAIEVKKCTNKITLRSFNGFRLDFLISWTRVGVTVGTERRGVRTAVDICKYVLVIFFLFVSF